MNARLKTLMLRAGRTIRKTRGQALAELAVTLPILLMLTVGVLDVGRAYGAYITIHNAAREGARYAAAHPADDTGIVARTRREAQLSGITLTTVTPSCPSGPGTCTPGNPVQVDVTFNFEPIVASIVGAGTITLRAAVQFVVL